jgi:hypothetical protein
MNIMIVAFLALLAGACSSSSTPASSSASNAPAQFRVVDSGSYGRSAASGETSAPTAGLALDRVEFEAQWRDIVGDKAIPTIDWTRESAVFLSLGSRSTGGHSVEARSVSYEGATADVTTEIRSPGAGEITTMAFTSPYTVIAVPRRNITEVRWRNEDGEIVARAPRARETE